jgi:hypothetical protein
MSAPNNSLTALAPVLYSAAQEVAAEAFGVVDAINSNFDDKAVAKGDKVKVPIAPAAALADFEPAAATPQGSDKTASTVEVEITASKKTSWHMTGEQMRSLENAGNDNEWVRQLIAQGMRTLRNQAEADCCNAVKVRATRAVGTAGTTPFASDIDIIAQIRKEMLDNGAPLSDLQLALNSSASLNMLKLGIVQQVFAAGTDQERRTGRLQPQFGFQIRESAGLTLHTQGTVTGLDVDLTAGYAAGTTVFNVDGGDGGTLKEGDVFKFATDANNQYVSHTAVAALTNDHLITIGKPGLRAATTADGVEITLAGNYTPNLAFERAAVVGIMRPPLIPQNPTIKQMVISDNKGMSYLLLEIAQYGMVTWELHLAWGFKVVQPEYVITLLG